MTRRKKSKVFLNRPRRFMLRFSDQELNHFFRGARRAGLSKVEYGRRKILDLPIADLTERKVPAEALAS